MDVLYVNMHLKRLRVTYTDIFFVTAVNISYHG